MDSRAVLITLCVLFTQARCKPVGSGDEQALNQTISDALHLIRTARNHLNEALPELDCTNVPEQVGLKQQPLSAPRLSTVHCYIQKLPNLTTNVSKILTTAAQFIKDAEKGLSNSTAPQSCSLPKFKNDPEADMFAQCFLEFVLEERPSKSNL